jgi:sugar/nucleoside kinase (ribokinase family)
VRKKKWADAARVVPHADAVVFSELDLDEPYAFAEDIASVTPIVIVTQSSRGADLFIGRERIHVPAYEIEEIDPTGAGDVFAAAFLVRYRECGDAVEAADFACCAASFVCEKEGTEGIPTLGRVLARMQGRRPGGH